MDIADLHIHTTASDGLLTPTEVVEWAIIKKVRAIGITDHDNVNGINEAICASLHLNIEIVPGIELNSQYLDEEIHILGYFIDYKSKKLEEKLGFIRDSRYSRMIKIISKLNLMGIKIDFENLKINSNSTSIGRPHIARVLVEKGYASNMKAAFDKYLGRNRPAYVERYRLSVGEGIELIESIGGVPVIAHPGLIAKKKYIDEILDLGIKGIEVYHTKHDANITSELLKTAKEKKLLITGGSDCHGMFVNKEPILGNVFVDYSLVQQIKKASKTI